MTEQQKQRMSRRGFLGGAAAGIATGAGAVGILAAAGDDDPSGGTPAAQKIVPFYGDHQAGIATPAQDRLAFASFDITTDRRDDVVEMLKSWTAAAELMTRGKAVGTVAGHPMAPPEDTGEAEGLTAANLTITVGYGPSLFDDRFGLAARRPAALVDIPPLPSDELEPNRVGGDLCIQACADDPQVAFHAVRNLTRLGRGVVVLRWFQLGFGRTATTSIHQSTPRNLMGFKDGTNNVVAEHKEDMSSFVWANADDQAWMSGGSYLVARRIRMLIESWDRDRLEDQQAVIGRQKISGAPFGGLNEHDPVDLKAKGDDGQPLIGMDAHVRLAMPESNGGQKILRRGYSYTDGIDPQTGQLDAGLFFICFQNDPERQFIAIQRQLGLSDALNEYIKHTGSGIYACPPGLQKGQSWGDDLFA